MSENHASQPIARIQATKRSKKPAHPTVRVALALWRDGDRKAALAALEQAVVDAPTDGEIHFQLGLMRAELGLPAAALTHLRAAVTHAPSHAAAHRYLGLTHAAAGQMPEAVDALLVAHRLQHEDATITTELGLALRATGLTSAELLARQPAAPSTLRATVSQPTVALLSKAFGEDPELVEAFLELPHPEHDIELHEILAAAVSDAIQHHPQYADLHYYAARLAERLGRLEDAATEGERALALNPGYVQALIHLGHLYARLQRDEQAIAALEHAIEFGGDYADVNYELGQLHIRAGRRHRAEAAFRRALQLNVNFTAARTAIEAMAAA